MQVKHLQHCKASAHHIAVEEERKKQEEEGAGKKASARTSPLVFNAVSDM